MTEKEYHSKIAFLEENMPTEPLMVLCRQGFSMLNSLYVKQLLTKYQANQDKISINDPKKAQDDKLNSLLRQKYSLRSQIRGLSNQFHSCKTDEEMADLSDVIDDKEKEYREILADIEHYDRHRVLREKVETPDFFALPDTEGGIIKGILSARSNLSIIKKEIEGLPKEAMYDEKHKLNDKYKSLEERRQKWSKKLKILENEKESKKI